MSSAPSTSTPWVPMGTALTGPKGDRGDTGPAGPSGPPPTYGTSLPESPSDGQEAILVDSLTNPTYQWRFRYNAGSTSPYKWELVGGSDKGIYVPVNEAINGDATWRNLSTDGPTFTLPRAGDWSFACQTNGTGSASGAGTAQIGICNGDTSPLYNYVMVWPNANYNYAINFIAVLVGLAAGSVMKMRYWGNANCSFHNRGMIVRPMRVS